MREQHHLLIKFVLHTCVERRGEEEEEEEEEEEKRRRGEEERGGEERRRREEFTWSVMHRMDLQTNKTINKNNTT